MVNVVEFAEVVLFMGCYFGAKVQKNLLANARRSTQRFLSIVLPTAWLNNRPQNKKDQCKICFLNSKKRAPPAPLIPVSISRSSF